ncbi:uncharacterized protein LOC121643965 isoform X1 [Melanotaenia boesemani]|uniref:uncharacterized protein LOC121643965 isoform X1 n=1 Tax=Melanotaenia boesemani TaxID=1250792 RepID=UPI001C05B95D|nr:uncharacterized protein LOC121643965 isoform X1 [Melanotaenia boesemani]
MVISCCAVGCTNRQGHKPGISFYRIPKNPERRRQWIAAINRKSWEPTALSRLCSEHFLNGQKSDNPLSPNYVPTVFAHTKSPQKRKAITNLNNFQRREAMKKRKRQEGEHRQAAKQLSMDKDTLSIGLQDDGHEDGIADEDAVIGDCQASLSSSVMCQTEMSSEDISSLLFECQQLQKENTELKEKIRCLDLFEQNSFENKDEKVKALTGLPNFQVLMAVFSFMKPSLSNMSNLTCFQQLMLTFLKLKLNVSFTFLSYLIGAHTSTVSKVFTNVINILNERLVPVSVVWPERENVQISLPMCFRKSFKRCMAIIDCFEINTEKPKDLKARAQTYSQYKSHNTMKYLIGITPQGVISFISKGWVGGQLTGISL